MGKIKILNDPNGRYQEGSVYEVTDIIRDYCKANEGKDNGMTDYVCRIPIASAIDFICEAWQINYKFV